MRERERERDRIKNIILESLDEFEKEVAEDIWREIRNTTCEMYKKCPFEKTKKMKEICRECENNLNIKIGKPFIEKDVNIKVN